MLNHSAIAWMPGSSWAAITREGRQFLRERRRVGAEAVAELIDKLDEQDAAAMKAALPALLRLVDVVADSSLDAFSSRVDKR